MKREMICIICPRGCTLCADMGSGHMTVTGNACPRGEQHAIGECTNPVRSVTSSVRISNREDTMVSVKSADPVPKGKMFEIMEMIRTASVEAPVKIGDVVLGDVFGTQIVATKEIL